jgi:hypothetical protein
MAKDRGTFAPNDRISHSVHGLGTIAQVSEQYTTITFDEAGTKKFVTRMLQLERSDSPVPAKPSRSKKKAKPAK